MYISFGLPVLGCFAARSPPLETLPGALHLMRSTISDGLQSSTKAEHVFRDICQLFSVCRERDKQFVCH